MTDKNMITKLQDLKEIVEKRDLQGAVLFAITKDGCVEYHTFAENKEKCVILGNWVKIEFSHIFNRIPFETVFGWGNKGKIKKISKKDWDSLSDKAKDWVRAIGITDVKYFDF